MRLFGENLKLSRIVEVPQAHRRPRLIFNLLEKPDVGTPSVNNNTDREATLELLQFWRVLPRILQAVWEAYLAQGPVQMSNLDIKDAYHCGTDTPLQVGAFAYVVPSSLGDEGCIICIDLVLSMGWVDSPKFFCMCLETLTDVANSLVDTDLLLPSYGAICNISATAPVYPHTLESLTHIDFYMDEIIPAVQGDPDS